MRRFILLSFLIPSKSFIGFVRVFSRVDCLGVNSFQCYLSRSPIHGGGSRLKNHFMLNLLWSPIKLIAVHVILEWLKLLSLTIRPVIYLVQNHWNTAQPTTTKYAVLRLRAEATWQWRSLVTISRLFSATFSWEHLVSNTACTSLLSSYKWCNMLHITYMLTSRDLLESWMLADLKQWNGWFAVSRRRE